MMAPSQGFDSMMGQMGQMPQVMGQMGQMPQVMGQMGQMPQMGQMMGQMPQMGQMTGQMDQMPQMGQMPPMMDQMSQMGQMQPQMPQMGAFSPQEMQGFAGLMQPQMPQMGMGQMMGQTPQMGAFNPQDMQAFAGQMQPQMQPQMPQMGAPAMQGFDNQMPQFGAFNPQQPMMQGPPDFQAQPFGQMPQPDPSSMQQVLAPNMNNFGQLPSAPTGQQYGSPFAPSAPQFYPPTPNANADAATGVNSNIQTQAGNTGFPGMAGQFVPGGNPAAMMYHPYVNPMTLGMMPFSYMPPPPGPAPYPFPSFNPPNYYSPSNEFAS